MDHLSYNCKGCKQYPAGNNKYSIYGCGIYFNPTVISEVTYERRIKYTKSCVCGNCLVKAICIDKCEARKQQWLGFRL